MSKVQIHVSALVTYGVEFEGEEFEYMTDAEKEEAMLRLTDKAIGIVEKFPCNESMFSYVQVEDVTDVDYEEEV